MKELALRLGAVPLVAVVEVDERGAVKAVQRQREQDGQIGDNQCVFHGDLVDLGPFLGPAVDRPTGGANCHRTCNQL